MNTDLQRTLNAINTATSGMDEQQLCFHTKGKWSSAQILEHLAMAFSGTMRGFERCLEAGKPMGDKPALRQRIRAFVVLDLGYFPKGRQAPKMVVPSGKLGGLEALEKIRTNLIAMDQLQAQCEQKFGDCLLLNHPILGPLTTRQWPKFHYVHTRHHMKQIVNLREFSK